MTRESAAPDTPRRLALALVKPFEEESECALPTLVDAVESALAAAEVRGAERGWRIVYAGRFYAVESAVPIFGPALGTGVHDNLVGVAVFVAEFTLARFGHAPVAERFPARLRVVDHLLLTFRRPTLRLACGHLLNVLFRYQKRSAVLRQTHFLCELLDTPDAHGRVRRAQHLRGDFACDYRHRAPPI